MASAANKRQKIDKVNNSSASRKVLPSPPTPPKPKDRGVGSEEEEKSFPIENKPVSYNF